MVVVVYVGTRKGLELELGEAERAREGEPERDRAREGEREREREREARGELENSRGGVGGLVLYIKRLLFISDHIFHRLFHLYAYNACIHLFKKPWLPSFPQTICCRRENATVLIPTRRLTGPGLWPLISSLSAKEEAEPLFS